MNYLDYFKDGGKEKSNILPEVTKETHNVLINKKGDGEIRFDGIIPKILENIQNFLNEGKKNYYYNTQVSPFIVMRNNYKRRMGNSSWNDGLLPPAPGHNTGFINWYLAAK